ncbi:MAG: YraN family protein [Chitinophagaceae bacterium]|nr:YraN family protein [Chitinophagaceae bacterium]
MSKHNEIGTNGELLAVNFLKNKGFSVLETNWRSGKKEIDIIAESGDCIVFIEVKTRSSSLFGYPEEAVTAQKKALLKAAAEDYFEQKACTKPIRFDIISILQGNHTPEIMHIEDAFF